MKREASATPGAYTAEPSLDDPERTLVRPAFDQTSRQHAQPAVPLTRVRRRVRPSNLALLVVVAAIAGGLLGAVAFTLYHRGRAPQTSTASPDGQRPATAPAANPAQPPAEETPGVGGSRAGGVAANGDEQAAPTQSDAAGAEADLRAALDDWLAATNGRDIDRQMRNYAPRINSYYQMRNASPADVRAEKSRVFARADAVDVRATAPEVTLSPDGRAATMRFRKDYAISAGGGERRGAVIQELRWRRTRDGWKIISERDLRVVH